MVREFQGKEHLKPRDGPRMVQGFQTNRSTMYNIIVRVKVARGHPDVGGYVKELMLSSSGSLATAIQGVERLENGSLACRQNAIDPVALLKQNVSFQSAAEKCHGVAAQCNIRQHISRVHRLNNRKYTCDTNHAGFMRGCKQLYNSSAVDYGVCVCVFVFISGTRYARL